MQRIPASQLQDHRPVVVSLFAGAGGLDLGLAAAGFDIAYESDIDSFSCTTLESNGPNALAHGLSGFEQTVVECADVLDLTGSHILSKVGAIKGSVDVLAGGPPCQAFSVFGRRAGIEDKRGQLIYEYARIVAEIEPKVFIFENVYGLLSIQNGAIFQDILKTLATPGDKVRYSVSWQRVNARDYAVPQSRDRVIVIGIRNDLIDSILHSPTLTPLTSETPEGSNLPRWRTVGDCLAGLPIPNKNTAQSVVQNHSGRKHGTEVTQRYSALAPGERDGRTRINRLDPARPSFTIVVGSDAGGGKGHVHPSEPRELTPRESARIQTFPDWWSFRGNVRHAIRQVGNAVPCLLGFAIGNSIRSQVFGLKEFPLETAVDSLGQTHLFDNPTEHSLIDRSSTRPEQLKLSV